MLFQAFVKYFTNFTYDTQFIAKSHMHTAYKCYSVINVLFICCQMTERPKSLPILLSFGNSPHHQLMEMRGLEPLTSSLQRRRSPD